MSDTMINGLHYDGCDAYAPDTMIGGGDGHWACIRCHRSRRWHPEFAPETEAYINAGVSSGYWHRHKDGSIDHRSMEACAQAHFWAKVHEELT